MQHAAPTPVALRARAPPPGAQHDEPAPRSLYALREQGLLPGVSPGVPSPPGSTGPGGSWGLAQAPELPLCRLPGPGTGLMLQPGRGLCYADLGPDPDRTFERRADPGIRQA
ncbi:hypothetical protein ATKI12_0494 [Kitasatospora sp. Ki12]